MIKEIHWPQHTPFSFAYGISNESIPFCRSACYRKITLITGRCLCVCLLSRSLFTLTHKQPMFDLIVFRSFLSDLVFGPAPLIIRLALLLLLLLLIELFSLFLSIQANPCFFVHCRANCDCEISFLAIDVFIPFFIDFFLSLSLSQSFYTHTMRLFLNA